MSYERGDGFEQTPNRNQNRRPTQPQGPRMTSQRRPGTLQGGAVPGRMPAKGAVPPGNRRQENVRTGSVRSGAVRETAAGRIPQTGPIERPAGAQRTPVTKTLSASGMGESPREVLAKAKIQRAKEKKRRRRMIVMIVAECFTLMMIFGYAYFARHWNMIQREDFNPKNVQNEQLSVEDIKKMKGYRMIAVFGVDSRSTDVGAGNQSDVNILCCINQDTGDIKLVSLYRDTYLNINDSGSYRKFNAAYANGGPEQALKAINKNLDLDITEYVTFSWKAVADSINILGGVDVEITKSEYKYINGFITETVKATGVASKHLSGPGLHHLDGVQAVAYGRLRLMDTDYARTERQRKIIELAFAKAKQADYSVLNNILVVILPTISTNLTFSDMTELALGISKYHIGETAGFPFAKGNANIPGKGDCVIPQTLESNVSQLHTFLFGDESYIPTDRVKQISSKIAQDSGMHREGKPSTGSALSTESYVPKETTAERDTEAETTIREAETDEDGNLVLRETDENGNLILGETDENGNVVDIYPGMTDENGELIDGPIEDWPEEPDYSLPDGQNGYGPYNPGTLNPTQPGGGRAPVTPGGESSPGGHDRVPGETGGPGSATQPSPGDSHQTGTNPSGTFTPGQGEVNAGSEVISPGGNTGSGTGSGGTTPGGTGSGGNTPGTSPGGLRPEDISGPGVQNPANGSDNIRQSESQSALGPG